MSKLKPMYHSNIWFEESESNDPFAAKNCYCHGYNVFEDILPKANWCEYLYLLFKGERPTKEKSLLLEKVAIAIANPGMRDESIRAAMNAGVGGSTAAASLIAAIGVGAGQYGGAREVYTLVEQWHALGTNLEKWQNFLVTPNETNTQIDIWPEYEHAPGFNPNGETCSLPVRQSLELFSTLSPSGALSWLKEFRAELENISNSPLSMSGLIACALFDLGMTAKQAEMLYLLLRLPGAAVHSLEQEKLGWKHFPFFGKETILTDDPEKPVKPSTGVLTNE